MLMILLNVHGEERTYQAETSDFRFVSQADIVHTPNTIRSHALGRRLRAVRPFGATKDLT